MAIEEKTVEKLKVKIFEGRPDLGKESADDVEACIKQVMKEKDEVNIVFAAAPSQNEFLAELSKRDIDWSRINAFHMDEYVGLDDDAPQLFGNFLKEAIFGKVPFKSVHYFKGKAKDLDAECQRYADLLEKHPTDICILGIGENTHLAFCDPHVADFNDPKTVKIVDLDEKNRNQQVNDGMFETIDDVPTHAITMTIPALLKSTYTFTIVPGSAKADAIYHTLKTEMQENYPSTILRTHPRGILYIDKASAAKL